MKIKISDFGVVRSPERFSHGPSTQADWTYPPHGSSGRPIHEFQICIFWTLSTKKSLCEKYVSLEITNYASKRSMWGFGPVRLSAGTVRKPLRRS